GVVGGLGAGQLAVSKQLADDKGWRVGRALPVTFIDGQAARLTIGAVYGNRDVVGDVLLPRTTWAPHAVQDIDATVLVDLKPGVALAQGRVSVERVASAYGGPDVQDRRQYV